MSTLENKTPSGKRSYRVKNKDNSRIDKPKKVKSSLQAQTQENRRRKKVTTMEKPEGEQKQQESNNKQQQYQIQEHQQVVEQKQQEVLEQLNSVSQNPQNQVQALDFISSQLQRQFLDDQNQSAQEQAQIYSQSGQLQKQISQNHTQPLIGEKKSTSSLLPPPYKRGRGRPRKKSQGDVIGFKEFADRLLEFMQYLMALKVSKRNGWIHRGMKECESIADHSYRMGVMALLVDPKMYDISKTLKLSLVHDMAECIVGDITPHCGIAKDEKLRREREGMECLLDSFGKETVPVKQVRALWEEYEDRETPEAKLVKDFDRIDLILQAITYQEENPRVNYQEFFDSAKNTWFTDIGYAMFKQK